MENLIHQFASKMRYRIKFVFYPLHLIFITVMVMGMLDTGIGATCSSNLAYPSIFYIAGVLFLVLFAVIVNCFLLDYLLHGDSGQNNDQEI